MKKINLKDFHLSPNTIIHTDEISTKFNKDGEMYKKKYYKNTLEKEIDKISDNEVYKGIDIERKKKDKKKKIKAKRCKCK